MDADNSNLETCLRAPTVASLTFGIRVLLYRAQLRHAPRVMVSPPVGYLTDVRVILRCALRSAHVTSKIYMIAGVGERSSSLWSFHLRSGANPTPWARWATVKHGRCGSFSGTRRRGLVWRIFDGCALL